MPKRVQSYERQWFADAMDRKGSRKEIARELGLSVNLLSEYATGRRTPRPKRAQQLGRYFGFNPMRFFDDNAVTMDLPT